MKSIIFKDYSDFRPNLTPKQMFQYGIFGGTYFRPIHSRVTNKNYKNIHKKYKFLSNIPEDKLSYPLSEKDINKNKYKVDVGTSLEFWEDSGWIRPSHPYGWINFYCDYYNGVRGPDDNWQIKRWLGICGKNGRFRNRLINMIKEKLKKNKDKNYTLKDAINDYTISPKIRQTLLHWAFEISEADFE